MISPRVTISEAEAAPAIVLTLPEQRKSEIVASEHARKSQATAPFGTSRARAHHGEFFLHDQEMLGQKLGLRKSNNYQCVDPASNRIEAVAGEGQTCGVGFDRMTIEVSECATPTSRMSRKSSATPSATSAPSVSNYPVSPTRKSQATAPFGTSRARAHHGEFFLHQQDLLGQKLGLRKSNNYLMVNPASNRIESVSGEGQTRSVGADKRRSCVPALEVAKIDMLEARVERSDWDIMSVTGSTRTPLSSAHTASSIRKSVPASFGGNNRRTIVDHAHRNGWEIEV